ncbi:MAG: hypothetical protein WC072_05395, partial [Methanoregulaceae archaeon]
MPELKLDSQQTTAFVMGLTHEAEAFDWEGRYTIVTAYQTGSVDCDHGYFSYTHARTAVAKAGGFSGPVYFLLPHGTGHQPFEAVSDHEGDPDLSCTIEFDEENRDVSDVTFTLGDRTLLTIERGFWTVEVTRMADRKFTVTLTLLMDPADEADLRERAASECNVDGADETDEQGEYEMPLEDVVLAIVESNVWGNVEFDSL